MNKLSFALAVFVLLLSANYSYGQQAAQKNTSAIIMENVYEDIDIQTAQKIMKLSKNYILLDVRTPEEIANGKIGNALEIDIRSQDFKDKLDKLDRNGQYIVYCHAGGRSTTAAGIMREMGFKQIYNLTDGYRAWPAIKSSDK